jgi:aerobic-type carbon monoxide dehydrogenase small subunit (CoxS/CutS family)
MSSNILEHVGIVGYMMYMMCGLCTILLKGVTIHSCLLKNLRQMTNMVKTSRLINMNRGV